MCFKENITSIAHKLPIFSTFVGHTLGVIFLAADVISTVPSSTGNSVPVFMNCTLCMGEHLWVYFFFFLMWIFLYSLMHWQLCIRYARTLVCCLVQAGGISQCSGDRYKILLPQLMFLYIYNNLLLKVKLTFIFDFCLISIELTRLLFGRTIKNINWGW